MDVHVKDEVSPVGSIKDDRAPRIGTAPGRNGWHGKELGGSSFIIIGRSSDAPFYLFGCFFFFKLET
jgi:hypothetical protein